MGGHVRFLRIHRALARGECQSFNDEHDSSASMTPLTVLVGLLRRVERKRPPGKRFEMTLLDQPAQRLEWDTG